MRVADTPPAARDSHDRGRHRHLIASNDDWGLDPNAASTAIAAQQAGAFALDTGSRDAALVITLQPGVYTVHASGVGGATGTALVEIYAVP